MKCKKLTGNDNSEMAATVNQLAKAIRVNQRSVYVWKKRADWPFGNPPYRICDIRRWRSDHLSQVPGVRSPAERERSRSVSDQLKKSRIDKIKTETQLLRDQFTKTIDADEIVDELIRFMLQPLERMVSQLPTKLVGRSAPSMEKIIDDHIEKMRGDWAQKIQDVIERSKPHDPEK